jgi:RNA polymerase sigma-B factor
MTTEALRTLDVWPGDRDAVDEVQQWFHCYECTHDPAVRERIILAYLGLADRLASRYRSGHGASTEDLVQTARLALVRAVDRYDPGRPSPFIAYAVVCITGELKRFLREWSWRLHVIRSDKEYGLQAVRTKDALTVALGRAPTVTEIADHLGMEEDAVADGLNAISTWSMASLDEPVEPNATVSVGDLVPTPPADTEIEDLLVLPELIAILPDQERQAIVLRFFDDLRQRDIGAVLGCSQMHVSRLLRQALRRMRQRLQPDETRGRGRRLPGTTRADRWTTDAPAG